MTSLALTSNTDLDLHSMIGSSIQLARWYIWPQSRIVAKKAANIEKASEFSVSSGISASANAVQQQVEEFAVIVQVQNKSHLKSLDSDKQSISSANATVLWEQLAQAAQNGDAQAFVCAYHQIDWSLCTPTEFDRAVHWALASGAHLAARALATRGAAQYPAHAELQKAARILAPPKVLRRLPAEPDKRANHEWLRANRTAYNGQWVALQNGQLLATADSFRTLIQQVAVAPEILFTKVI